MNRLEIATKHLSALGAHLNVKYSPYTDKWFCHLEGTGVSNGSIIGGGFSHEVTPEEAVIACFEHLSDKVLHQRPFVTHGTDRIVVEHHTGRRAFCWNGVAFYQVSEDTE